MGITVWCLKKLYSPKQLLLFVFKANTWNFATCAEVIKQESEYNITSNDKDVLELDTKIKVENLVIYPIKSCGGFGSNIWPLSNSGELCLLFMIVDYRR